MHIKLKTSGGVSIKLTKDEVAAAINAYLVSHRVIVHGPSTVSVNTGLVHRLCPSLEVCVDPSGHVIQQNGFKIGGDNSP